MWRGESNPLKTFDFATCSKQFREGTLIAKLNTVGVDVLTQERDLDHSLGNESTNLSNDVFWAAIALLASKRRHNAKRAGVVAANRDADPGREC